MGVEFQKAHGPWTLSSAHGRAMSQSSIEITTVYRVELGQLVGDLTDS